MSQPDPITVLKNASVVAIVGASTRIHRPSHHAVDMLATDGYTVFPINPRYRDVFGLRCYPSLSDLPDAIDIDIVNVFRRPEAVPDLLDEIASRVDRTGKTPVVWTQLGVSSTAARSKATELNLPYIEERCIMVELERLAGRRRRR